MKRLVIFTLTLLLGTGTVFAQQADSMPARKAQRAKFRRLEAGVRGGVNFADYAFSPVRIGDNRFTPGKIRTGYEAGFILRLNLSRHLHLQTELDYNLVNYAVHADGKYVGRVSLRVERFEIPVQLGFQFGFLHLFGGARFRLGESQRSSAPQLLRIAFNDSDIALQGGAGIKIRSFFLDFSLTGYPQSRIRHDFISRGLKQRVSVSRDLVYAVSMGFLF